MAENSKIQWTTHTFNPWRGCVKVAAGCANCYAESQSKRNPTTLGVWGPSGTRVVASESMWRQPVKWNRDAEPDSVSVGMPRVFCGSMCDVFESWPGRVVQSDGSVMWNRSDIGLCTAGQTTVGGVRNERVATLDDVRSRLFRLIDATPNLDWLLLTKRPENIRRMWELVVNENSYDYVANSEIHGPDGTEEFKRDNVWLGASAATQEEAERNLRELPKDLSAVRFLSLEPLLEPVDLLKAWRIHRVPDWVIVGGESGHNARPCALEWIWDIVLACKAAGVPCFVKQLGSFAVTTNVNIWDYPIEQLDAWGKKTAHSARVKLRHPKGGDPVEWPFELNVRQFPMVAL